MKRKMTIAVVLILLVSLVLGGCANPFSSRKNSKGSEYVLYYTNQSKTELVTKPHEPVSDPEDKDAMIGEFINAMLEEPESVDYWRVLPQSVVIQSYDLDGAVLTVDFNSAYNRMDSSLEILCRGAVSKNLLQIPGVAGVTFTIDGKPLVDAKGERVGLMTADTFVLDTDVDENNIEEEEFILYFASQDGQNLVKEHQKVHYLSSISVEKAVMLRLLAGPQSSGRFRAIPLGTDLISISVMDGVCFVNLDDNFLNQDFNVSEEVVIYSIVDSLTELETVNTVQISVNGDTNRVYRDKVSLSELFTRNLDYVVE